MTEQMHFYYKTKVQFSSIFLRRYNILDCERIHYYHYFLCAFSGMRQYKKTDGRFSQVHVSAMYASNCNGDLSEHGWPQ